MDTYSQWPADGNAARRKVMVDRQDIMHSSKVASNLDTNGTAK